MKRYLKNIISVLSVWMFICPLYSQDLPANGGTVNAGTYTLTKNYSITTPFSISGKVIIDLNGKNIDAKNTGFVFVVDATCELTIKGNGIIRGGRGDRGGCAYVAGTLNLQGGTIQDCQATDSNKNDVKDAIHYPTQGSGGAIFVNNGGVFNMSGGTIKNCSTDETNHETFGLGGAVFIDAESTNVGVFNMSGGTISNCSASKGGGVYVHKSLGDGDKKNASFNMTGGTISGCNAIYGGGIFANGIVEVSGSGTITGNRSKYLLSSDISAEDKLKIGGGGGIYINTNAQCTIKGNAKIEKNNSLARGSGIAVYCGTLKMEGGNISDNIPYLTLTNNWVKPEANTTPDNIKRVGNKVFGGGVYLQGSEGIKALFEMTGGTISENVAASGGGVGVWPYSEFIMDGDNAKIESNYSIGEGGNGNGGAIYIQSGTVNFRKGQIIGNKAVRYGGGINSNASGTLTFGGNCIVNNNMAVNGGGLSQEQGLCIMDLSANGIQINNNYAVQNGGGLFIEKGKLILGSGAELSFNKAGKNGGGASLYVQRIDGDVEAIIDGKITNNEAGNEGGGIDLYAHVEASDVKESLSEEDQPDKNSNLNSIYVYLNSGILKGNKAVKGGAGIHVWYSEEKNGTGSSNTATFNVGTKDTKPLIEDNISSDGNGGGLSMNSGIFKLINADLKNNEAVHGGGIYVAKGTFNVTNCEITQNIAKESGGGIYVGSGQFTISGNMNINGNTASGANNTGKGGGVYLGGGTFFVGEDATLKVGEIAANTSSGNGGGIYCASPFIVEGQAIVKNNQANNGGGICIENGRVSFAVHNDESKNSIIENNKATIHGGGLYVVNNGQNQEAIFKGGVFKNNQAAAGGAVSAVGQISLQLDATMEENIAEIGGGIYMDSGVRMQFGDGLIRSNSATGTTSATTAQNLKYGGVAGVGGGIFMGDNTALTFTNTKEMGIYNNSASNAGADICVNGNSTSITLPYIKDMQLTGFDVQTSGDGLYWVDDYFDGIMYTPQRVTGQTQDLIGIRYEKLLKDLSKPIEDYIITDIPSLGFKFDNKYLCLELGYDLIFVELRTTGLNDNDDAEIIMSPVIDGNTRDIYRKIYFTGECSKTVGLPSGTWEFEGTKWAKNKYKDPEFYVSGVNINGTFQDLNRVNYAPIEVKFELIQSITTKTYMHRKVNRFTKIGN